MKIAIDLDGVAWKHSELFKVLIRGFKQMGHEVGILTAHIYSEYRDKDIELWTRRGFPKVDFYIGKSDEDRHMPIGEWKMRKIVEEKIEVLFDDFGGNNPAIEKTFMESGYYDLGSKVLILKVIGSEK